MPISPLRHLPRQPRVEVVTHSHCAAANSASLTKPFFSNPLGLYGLFRFNLRLISGANSPTQLESSPNPACVKTPS